MAVCAVILVTHKKEPMLDVNVFFPLEALVPKPLFYWQP